LTWQQCEIYRDAITIYRAALAKNPDLWMLHGNLGDALLESKKTEAIDEAIDELGEALRLNPRSDDAHYHLGKALLEKRRWQEAARHFEEVLNLPSKKYQNAACHEMAEFYFATGRRSDALEMAEKALAMARAGGDNNLVKQIEDWIATRRLRESAVPPPERSGDSSR